jgi:MoxR-like ATPase
MLDLPHNGVAPDMLGEVKPLLGVVSLDKARAELDRTVLPELVGRYMVELARQTRELPGVELGVSSRGLIHLASAAKANARLSGRDTVTVQDVREVAPYVLRHRIIVGNGDMTPDKALRLALARIRVPNLAHA